MKTFNCLPILYLITCYYTDSSIGQVSYSNCETPKPDTFCMGVKNGVVQLVGGNCFIQKNCDVFIHGLMTPPDKVTWEMNLVQGSTNAVIDTLFFVSIRPDLVGNQRAPDDVSYIHVNINQPTRPNIFIEKRGTIELATNANGYQITGGGAYVVGSLQYASAILTSKQTIFYPQTGTKRYSVDLQNQLLYANLNIGANNRNTKHSTPNPIRLFNGVIQPTTQPPIQPTTQPPIQPTNGMPQTTSNSINTGTLIPTTSGTADKTGSGMMTGTELEPQQPTTMSNISDSSINAAASKKGGSMLGLYIGLGIGLAVIIIGLLVVFATSKRRKRRTSPFILESSSRKSAMPYAGISLASQSLRNEDSTAPDMDRSGYSGLKSSKKASALSLADTDTQSSCSSFKPKPRSFVPIKSDAPSEL